MSDRIEYCLNCGNPTGRAGAGDDSIYIGSIGPLCEDCYSTTKPTESAPAMRKEDGRIRELQNILDGEWRKGFIDGKAEAEAQLAAERERAETAIASAVLHANAAMDNADRAEKAEGEANATAIKYCDLVEALDDWGCKHDHPEIMREVADIMRANVSARAALSKEQLPI